MPAQRRRRREPVPAVRAALLAARARIDAADGAVQVARTTTEEAARLTGADVAALVLRGVAGPRVLALYPGGPGSSGDLWGPATLAALLGLGHPVRRVVEDDPLAGGDATALLAVPVPSGGSVVGSLLVRRHVARAFGAGDQDVLSRLARMVGAVLAVPADAGDVPSNGPGGPGGPSTDPVTGLPGARRLAADIQAAVRTAERERIPVAVLAAHLEGLGRVRAELGDEAAEDVLRMLARALAELLRVGDVAYRIGPDEVALLLPVSDDDAVPTVRERLEEIAPDLPAAAGLPATAPRLGLLTAPVPLAALQGGADAVDAALAALGVAPQRVRSGRRPVLTGRAHAALHAWSAATPARRRPAARCTARSSAACNGPAASATAASRVPPWTAATSASASAAGSTPAGSAPPSTPARRPASSSPRQRANAAASSRRMSAPTAGDPASSAASDPSGHPAANPRARCVEMTRYRQRRSDGASAGASVSRCWAVTIAVALVLDDRSHEARLVAEVVVQLRLARARGRPDVVEGGRRDAGPGHQAGGRGDDQGAGGRAPGCRADGQHACLTSTADPGSLGVGGLRGGLRAALRGAPGRRAARSAAELRRGRRQRLLDLVLDVLRSRGRPG